MKKIIYLFICISSYSYSQTTLVSDINASGDSDPKLLTNVNGTIFFSANNGTDGEALWKTDGVTTSLVKDIRTAGGGAPANITRLLPVGNSVFFRANDDNNGKEPWFSDGTELGTNMILNINAGSASSTPNNYINHSGIVYFLATDGINGAELWTSDGTSGNTSMVRDINPGAGGSNPQNLVVFNSQVFFAATDGTSGFELWRSDGTSGGTVQVLDIQPGANSGLPKFLTDVNGTLFFQADDGTNGIELWTSDGTGGGTSLVTNINAGGSAFIRYITNLNGSAIFQADDGATGAELWISDGTALGTVQVADINPGATGSTPENFMMAGGILYFTADNGTNGVELWRSDGTGGGTFMVSDINVGAGSSNPDNLTDVNGALYFSANDGTNGTELWKTDGTAGGTVMVENTNAAGSSNPNNFAVKNSVVYYAANDGVVGNELRSTVLNQATNLTVGATTASTIDLSWTNGSGTRRMVIARAVDNTYREPVDGISYVANAEFLSGSNIGGAHYVVYDGTGESVTVTGLGATSTYYFTVFEYIGTGNEIDYIVKNKENVPGTTVGVTEPTSIASNMTFSAVTQSSFQVNWNNTGDGARRIVVARKGSAVTKVPTDGVTYASSGTFAGGGANLGGEQYVVYDGTGNSFTLSGLTNTSTYHLAVFEYNGTGGTENYLTTNSLKGSQMTSAPVQSEPTTIASNMTFSEISETSYRVTWNNTGNGARRIVVARRLSSVTKKPSDGVTYSSNNQFAGGGANLGGQQYVVYDGTGNTFVMTGLDYSTTYHLAVFEYNVGVPGTENYLTSISLTGSQATGGVTEPTLIASNLVFGTTTSSTMDISWTNSGNGANRIVVVRKIKAVSRFPEDGISYNSNNVFAGGGSNLGGGQYVVFDGPGNSFTLSGLEASSTYHIAVFEYNGSSGNENYLTSSYLTGSNTTSAPALMAQENDNALPINSKLSDDIHISRVRISDSEITVNINNSPEATGYVEIYDGNGRLLGRKDVNTTELNNVIFDRTLLGTNRFFIIRLITPKGVESRKYLTNQF